MRKIGIKYEGKLITLLELDLYLRGIVDDKIRGFSTYSMGQIDEVTKIIYYCNNSDVNNPVI